MKDQKIIYFGRFIFGLFFLAGNTCLFGYILTKEYWFADSGFLLITYGTVFNIIVLSILLIYAAADRSASKACLQSAGLILINIPIAILYTIIGCNLVIFN
ncbi:hypothetical protein EU348_20145 [Chryseobacterium indologenes]|uniref:Branched-chain amino acid:cation transporter, LIVCS family n=1 Tax=Chryseobacterium indologenes TaxID=253 RepID=A0A411DSK8_CHRID|nr:hypothetical protein EU348_20145 [Chryseobacterium indologenes]